MLIANLDSAQFEVRQEASRTLEKMGDAAERAMRQAIQAQPQLETQKRLNAILEKRDKDPEVLRRLRAAEMLEQIGSSQARQLVELLIETAPSPTVQKAASAALLRLVNRSP